MRGGAADLAADAYAGAGGFVFHPFGLNAKFVDVDRAFLDGCRCQTAQVIGGLEALAPSEEVHVVEFAATGLVHIQVQTLAHVDPLLATRGAFDNPVRFHLEGRLIARLQILGHTLDIGQVTIVIFQLLQHVSIPKLQRFQVLDQLDVNDSEFAGEIRLHVEVFVRRLDGLRHADDVGNSGGGSNGHHV